jgi:RNA polymerase sigma-70 factor, ECF subfamily
MSAVAQSRDQTAFEAIYRENYPNVFRYVLVRTGHRQDAEDVTNETFERAYRAWDGGSPAHPPLPWLLQTARRLTTDRWRRARRFVFVHLNPARHDVTEPATGEPETLRWLEALGEVLSPHQREAIVLRYQRDLSDADIATIMSLTPSGVRSLISRALTKLRDHPEVWQ